MLRFDIIYLREYGHGKHKQIDDYQYGGGAGMVMMVEPLSRCIEGLQQERNYDEIIYVTPDGNQLNQQSVNKLSLEQNIPGVLNDGSSALSDSYQDNLLAPPVYTRPAEYDGMQVPDVLLSGNDALIEEWRYEQALKRTQERRPDLLED